MQSLPLPERLQVWSAAPTPFDTKLNLDPESVKRMVKRHKELSVDGLFLAGTCGEGPWMPVDQRLELVETACAANSGLKIAVQVTDNSPARMLEFIKQLPPVDYAIVAQPYFVLNDTPTRRVDFYQRLLDESPVPIGYYDRGASLPGALTPEELQTIGRHPRLKIVKDSSADKERRQVLLQIRAQRPDLLLFNGDEFACVDYMKAGYDGMLLGGGVMNAGYIWETFAHLKKGAIEAAEASDARMCAMQTAVYGGKDFGCWLTGLKHALVELGIFSSTASYLDYPLTESCRKEMTKVLKEDSAYLQAA